MTFFSVLSKRFHPVSVRKHNKSAQRKTAKHQKTSSGINSKQKSTILSNTKNLEAKKRHSRVRKGLQLKKNTLPLINNLPGHGDGIPVFVSVYSKSLNMESVTEQELPKYQPFQLPKYQIDLLKKKISKKLFADTDSLVDKILSCLCIRVSKWQTFFLDGVETDFLLSNFAH